MGKSREMNNQLQQTNLPASNIGEGVPKCFIIYTRMNVRCIIIVHK